MCGIVGMYAFNQIGRLHMINLAKATDAIQSRGPDHQDIYFDDFVGLGHRRLVIIDPSFEANQPMTDSEGRYYLNYNGEIYNFKSIRKSLESMGIEFRTQSDTEVLLHLLIRKGIEGLNEVNGFFAFAFYDKMENTMLLCRDRFGIKPLYYLADDDKVLFASEMKALFQFGIDKRIDYGALLLYLQLNYIPAPDTIISQIRKLEPGRYLSIKDGRVEHHRYFNMAYSNVEIPADYQSQKERIHDMLETSVRDRLVSDVPLGTFLSGGIDSSIISALAKRHLDNLSTFSIGYSDRSYFDESKFARRVARHIGSDHTVFMLSNADLFEDVASIMDYIDEPFADSSSIAVYILSKRTRQEITVALSGDGADELFGGYNKHEAFFRMIHPGGQERAVQRLAFLWRLLPQSRNGMLSNRFRQLNRFAEISSLEPREAYMALASFLNQQAAASFIRPEYFNEEEPVLTELAVLETISNANPSVGQMLQADFELVLPNDMLHKVDQMSMAHGLEVRVPFLDHRLVEFVNRLPDETRIRRGRKRILKDSFMDLLPSSIINRKKHGFEVPLRRWFHREMKSTIFDKLLDHEFIEDQGIFVTNEVEILKRKFFSVNPGDSHATIWALAVFQHWYKRYFGD